MPHPKMGVESRQAMKTNQVLAVGYGRTSGEDKSDKKVSVDAQKDEFEKACAANNWKGIWFEDRGISGRAYPTGATIADLDTITSAYLADKNTKQRTRKGLATALSSGASILWVRSLDRFSRPLSGSYLDAYLRSELVKNKMTLWTGETGKVDYSKFETRLISALTHETKDEDIKSKTKGSTTSRNIKRDSGLLYTDPYSMGFRTAGRGKIQVIQSELETVKQIFKLYMANPTVRHVCVTLHKQGVKPFESKTWGRKSITNILKRPWYAGYQYNSHGTLIPSPVFKPHAVVSLLDFERVQNRLAQNVWAGIKRESKYAHPLAGLIRCGYCGALMVTFRSQTPKNPNPIRYYRCKNTYNDAQDTNPSCNRALIRETMGELASIDQTSGYLSEHYDGDIAGLIEALYPFCVSGYIKQLSETDTTPELQAKREELKSQLLNLNRVMESDYEEYHDNKRMTQAMYDKRFAKSQEQEREIKTTLYKIEKEITQASSKTNLTFADTDKLESMSHRTYSALLRKIVKSVFVYSDKIEIHLVDSEKTISLPRVKIGNSRQIPSPEISPLHPNGKTLSGEVLVMYPYPSTQITKPENLYSENGVTVITTSIGDSFTIDA